MSLVYTNYYYRYLPVYNIIIVIIWRPPSSDDERTYKPRERLRYNIIFAWDAHYRWGRYLILYYIVHYSRTYYCCCYYIIVDIIISRGILWPSPVRHGILCGGPVRARVGKVGLASVAGQPVPGTPVGGLTVGRYALLDLQRRHGRPRSPLAPLACAFCSRVCILWYNILFRSLFPLILFVFFAHNNNNNNNNITFSCVMCTMTSCAHVSPERYNMVTACDARSSIR